MRTIGREVSAIGRRKLAAVGALAFALLAAALLWRLSPEQEAAPAAPTATARLKIDPNLGGKPTPVPQEPGVAIRGWRSMLLPSGVTEVDTALNNPEENEGLYYLTYQLSIKETGEVLFSTGLIPPGLYCTQVTLSRPLEKGEYECVVLAQPYRMTDPPTPTNNATFDVRVVVQ